MNRPTILELLGALERASEEHDAWLGTLREFNDAPHPWIGMGAPASEVAQVLVYGETRHTQQQRLRNSVLARHGLTLAQWTRDVDWDRYAALRDEMFGADFGRLRYETDSERSTAVAALMRARREGLIAKGEHGYWQITDDGDQLLREQCADEVAA